ncbi:MAG TPA: SRPBCC family protein, partial [Pilimelia sp.]|nr:SRPBCC family protein [Pilimelia sp.]
MNGQRDAVIDGEATATIDVPAPAETVYGVLTDLSRVTRWLPVGMVAEPVTADRIRVRAYGRNTEVRLTRDVHALTVGWSTTGEPRLTAAAEVREAGAG